MSENNIKEVILHMGLKKTGTSSIQSTLYHKANNNLLLNEGILYPRCWTSNHTPALHSAFFSKPETLAQNKIPKILSKEEIENKNRSNLEKLAVTINNSDATRLIISGESIPELSKEEISEMKKYFMDIGLEQATFKIIIYTRDPVTWSVSFLQQQLKGISAKRYGKALKRIKDKILPDFFQKRIGNLMDIFGKEAVHVFPFEDARKHEMGMVGHFLEELNVDKKVIKDLEQIHKNESISMFTGEFLAYINDRFPLLINGKHNEKRHKIDHQPLLSIDGDKFDITLTEKKMLASIVKQDVAWLKKNYGIDYSAKGIKETERYNNLDLSFKDVKRVYPVLTKTLRDALLEFLENNLLLKIPSIYKEQCHELIRLLKEQEEDLTRIDRQEQKIQNALNLSGFDKGIMYKELAQLMEAYDQLGVAELMMQRARLYRPNNDLIRKKHEEYKQRLGYENFGYMKMQGKGSDSKNEDRQSTSSSKLSRKKKALFGIGIASNVIGIFILIKRMSNQKVWSWKEPMTDEPENA